MNKKQAVKAAQDEIRYQDMRASYEQALAAVNSTMAGTPDGDHARYMFELVKRAFDQYMGW